MTLMAKVNFRHGNFVQGTLMLEHLVIRAKN